MQINNNTDIMQHKMNIRTISPTDNYLQKLSRTQSEAATYLKNKASDKITESEINTMYERLGQYGMIHLNTDIILWAQIGRVSSESIDTQNYILEQTDNPYVIRIKSNVSDWDYGLFDLRNSSIQTDLETEKSYLIDGYGVNGLKNALVMNDELLNGLHKVLGTDTLETSRLNSSYTVYTDKESGIETLSKKGDGWQHVVMVSTPEEESYVRKLEQIYTETYPNITSKGEISSMYANFELAGFVERTPNGIFIIYGNAISYSDETNRENSWFIEYASTQTNLKLIKDMMHKNFAQSIELEDVGKWLSIMDEMEFEYDRVSVGSKTLSELEIEELIQASRMKMRQEDF